MAELFIYDVIGKGMWEASEGDITSAESLRNELKLLGQDEPITLRINSPGGDIFEANAIMSLLQSRGSYDVLIDGVAASAASYVASGGSDVQISEGGMVMIHDPWTITAGDAGEHEKARALLEKIGGQVAGIYAQKAGKSVDDVRSAMREETWLTAEESVEFGLVDSIREEPAAAWKVPDVFGYRHTPQQERREDEKPLSVAAMQRKLQLIHAELYCSETR